LSEFIDAVKLVRCFEVVSRCSREVSALTQVLNDLILENLTRSKSDLPCVLNGEAIQSMLSDDSGWVNHSIAYSFPLKTRGKGRKRTEMFLSYQISLAGDGVVREAAGLLPVLHVCLWGSALDFYEGNYMAFPVFRDDREVFEITEGRLLRWGTATQEKVWTEYAWTFSVQLTALNNLYDLNRLVVSPALELLRGANVHEALPDHLRGLVHYTDTMVH
jgi:hypothetical protein